MLHTTFVILVYSNQCIIQDNCRHGPDTDFQNISREENLSGQSVSGDCFVPYEEKCRITWSTIVVWVLLINIVCSSVLSAKEVFQLMHSQNLYILNWENWVQWGIIINVVMVSFHSNPLSSLQEWEELVSRWTSFTRYCRLIKYFYKLSGNIFIFLTKICRSAVTTKIIPPTEEDVSKSLHFSFYTWKE